MGDASELEAIPWLYDSKPGDMMKEIVGGIGNAALSSSQREGDLPCWAIRLTGLNPILADKVLVSEHSFHTLSFFFPQSC